MLRRKRAYTASISAFCFLISAFVACHREQRSIVPTAQEAARPQPASLALHNPYEGNAYAIGQGQQLFDKYNCSGCHFHGGGGMGVALMDSKWRYGGRIDQIVASIAEGRPNGMPAWRGRLTEQQMWQLAAYVRTLSGQAPKDAVSARADEMSNTPPQTQTRREPVKSADSDQQ